MHRLAVVFVPSCVMVAAATGWLIVQRHDREYAVVPPVIIAARAPVVKAKPPHVESRFDRPIGGQFLAGFENVLATDRDMPVLFALSQEELRNFRFSSVPESIAMAMVRELGAVADEACPSGCGEVKGAIAALEERQQFAPPVVRRRYKTEDVGELRSIVVRSPGQPALEVTCTLASEYLGMQTWNDSVTCDATIRTGKRVIATYKPRHVHETDDRIPVLIPIDAYIQTAELGDGTTLMIETGSASAYRGVVRDDAR